MNKENLLIIGALVIVLLGWYAVSSGLIVPQSPVRTPGPNASQDSADGYFWADQTKWKVVETALSYDQQARRGVKFHMEYPRDFNVFYGDTGGGYTNLANPTLGKFSLTFPDDAFVEPPTNFGLGSLTLAATNVDTDKCFDPLAGGLAFGRTERVGDLDFKVATTSQAAAGTRYVNEIYRTLAHGACLEVDLIVGIANIGNFDPGMKVEELSEEEPLSVLRQMLHTIRITEEEM